MLPPPLVVFLFRIRKAFRKISLSFLSANRIDDDDGDDDGEIMLTCDFSEAGGTLLRRFLGYDGSEERCDVSRPSCASPPSIMLGIMLNWCFSAVVFVSETLKTPFLPTTWSFTDIHTCSQRAVKQDIQSKPPTRTLNRYTTTTSTTDGSTKLPSASFVVSLFGFSFLVAATPPW